MSAGAFKDLLGHVGHSFECVVYGKGRGAENEIGPGDVDNVALECLTCNEVIVDFDRCPGCARCGSHTMQAGEGPVLCMDETCGFAYHDQSCTMGWEGHPTPPCGTIECTCLPTVDDLLALGRKNQLPKGEIRHTLVALTTRMRKTFEADPNRYAPELAQMMGKTDEEFVDEVMQRAGR